MSTDPEAKAAMAAHEGKPPGVSRRGFLKAGAGAAAVLAAAGAGCTSEEEKKDHHHHAEPKPLTAEEQARVEKAEKEWYESFSEPSTLSLERPPGPALESADAPSEAVVEGTLRVIMTPITFRDTMGTRTENVRTYNGQVPGPTFRVRAGEALKVKLINDLPKNTDQFCVSPDHDNMNRPHCFNTTNLHVHGLHVSPKPPSDNVFIEIPPREEDPVKGIYEFCFRLPAFHKPGTHWYHAHKHGSTAIQLVNGMAGALIVEDPPGQSLDPRPIADVIMIIQEIVAQTANDVYKCATAGDPAPTALFYVNGRYKPTFNAIAGEVYRWRFINATSTPRGFTPLQLRSDDGRVLHLKLIAVDGIYLPGNTAKDVTSWMLSPGNRADFLVRFDRAGEYTVLKDAYKPGGGRDPFPPQALLEIQVTAPAMEMAMEMADSVPALPEYLRPITDEEIEQAKSSDATQKTVSFDVSDQEDCAGKFQVDKTPFNPNDPGIEVNLGETQVWTIRNNSGADHPFHIHVNPFQVINDNGKAIPASQRYWQDTVLVPRKGYVTFATRFETFDGPFVLHCHILIHEDWGMMKKVVVKGNGYGPCVPVP